MTIFDINKFQTNLFIFKALYNLLPPVFADFFTLTEDVHSYNTRFQSKNSLYVLPMENNKRKTSLKISGPPMWFQLPNELKKNSYIANFIRLYKKNLIANPTL